MIVYLLCSKTLESVQIFDTLDELIRKFYKLYKKYPINDFQLLKVDCSKVTVEEGYLWQQIEGLEGEELERTANRILKGKRITIKGDHPLSDKFGEISLRDGSYNMKLQNYNIWYAFTSNQLKTLLVDNYLNKDTDFRVIVE